MRKTKWLILCVIVLVISVSPLLVGCKHKHEWSNLLYNNECHYIQCNTCFEKKDIEEHTYNENNVCVCGKKNYNHEHDYSIPGGDDDYHWISCKVCGSVKNVVRHTISGYEKNDTHHWQVCTYCNIKINYAEHEFVGISCKQCKYIRP